MIGRVKELELLNSLCEEDKSKLVVIHGRRRIGKTFLVDYMFQTHRTDCLFFKFTGSADQNSSVQKDYFVEAVYDWFKVEPAKPIQKWHEAFIFLKRTIENEIEQKKHQGKVIIFIDEVAWIDRHNKSGFLSAFGHFYNTYIEKNNNLIVILCGSNASWIKNKILKDTAGPLYHRVDVEIPLYSFDLQETKEYLQKEKRFDIDDKSVVDIYMILGGVAKYLSYLDGRLSIAQNINNLFFSLHSPLYGEYEALFKSLFYDRSSNHRNIMDIFISKHSGFDMIEIENLLENIKSSTLRSNIDELIDTGFIKPVSRYAHASKNTKYIVCDPFCNFFTKWVQPLSKNDIASLVDYFETKSVSHDYIIWQGFAFEMVMITNLDLYLKVRGLSSGVKSIGYWDYISQSENDSGAQIDILIEYIGNTYDIVECKYYNDEFVIDKNYTKILQNKKDKFIAHGIKNKKFDLKMVMLTTYGTKINQYYNQVPISKDIKLEELI
ncbi:MAG: ATP-binding protein [Campylobacterota bacterium]|nr:ATP-binding protein [Campylobacterota bacterium]